MTETLAHGYSSKSSQQELSHEYQYDRVHMVFKNLCVLVLWTKVASALEGFDLFMSVYFVNISLAKATSRKYLMEKCKSEH